jgi:hypothetical protein
MMESQTCTNNGENGHHVLTVASWASNATWLDFEQRYLKVEVLRHGCPRMEICFDHVRLKTLVPWK